MRKSGGVGRGRAKCLTGATPPPPPTVDHGGYRPQLYTSHGMDTLGGRGDGATVPVIIKVNVLTDTGAALALVGGAGTTNDPFVYTGELRAALLWAGPRFVVFEVSGYIDLGSSINITTPYVTVAGQTAPSPGICLRMAAGFGASREINIAEHDVVFQHFAIRPGSDSCNSAVQVYNFDNPAFVPSHIVCDHLSLSWAQDEGVFFSAPASNCTIWRSIIAEILHSTPGSEVCGGGGLSEGHGIGVGVTPTIAVLQSLIAHNRNRNPQIGQGSSGVIQNNLFYGTHLGPLWFSFDATPWAWRADGNYLRRDLNTESEFYAFASADAPTGSELYLNDNVLDNSVVSPDFTAFHLYSGIDPRIGTPPVSVSGYTPLSGADSYAHVLSVAGARPLDRDAVDTRIVSDVGARSGGFVSSISAVGGYPALAQNSGAFSVPSNPFGIADAVGRTNLEAYLESLALALES